MTVSYTDLTKTRSCLFQNLLPYVTERHPCRVQNAYMKQKSPFSRGGCGQTSHLSIEVPRGSQVVLILFYPTFTPLLDPVDLQQPQTQPQTLSVQPQSWQLFLQAHHKLPLCSLTSEANIFGFPDALTIMWPDKIKDTQLNLYLR